LAENIKQEETIMRKLFIYGIIAAALLALASLAYAQKAPPKGTASEKPGYVSVKAVVIKASVEDINKENRTITLKGPRGNLLTVKASDDIKNFNQINKGDEVVARYYESVAIIVDHAKNARPKEIDTESVEVAPLGSKPAGKFVNTEELTAVVSKINYKKRLITLKLPEGEQVTLKVDPSVKKFKKIKKGDEVFVRHTEALAISVEAPSK